MSFPISEYGGIWNVIAINDEECFELIATEDGDLNKHHYGKLREKIQNAQKFALLEDYQSGVIEAFIT